MQLSKLGVAMLKSNVDPDEAIVLYESLLQAQDGLNMESWLHLLYLVTPLDHRVRPNFSALLSLYEAAKRGKQPHVAAVIEAVGIEMSTLCRLHVRPPSSTDLDLCDNAVRLFVLHRSMRAATDRVDEGEVLKPPALTSRSTMTMREWKVLSRCKRIWAAILLEKVLEGRPVEVLAKEFEVSVADIDLLRGQAAVVAAKAVKFCREIGCEWND